MGGVKRSSSRKIAISDFKGILANLSQFQPPPPPSFSGWTQFLSNLHLLYSCREFFLSELFGPQHNLSVSHLQKAVLGHYQHKHQQHHQHRNCDHPHRHHHQQQHHISNVPTSSSSARSNICPQSLLKKTFGSHYKGEKFRHRIAKPCFPRY